MTPETWFFDPDQIEIQLRRDTAGGLRMIADAIESGQLDARVLHCAATGLNTDWRDTRAHVLVKLELAGEIRKQVKVLQELRSDLRKELP